jgi:SAM-dependent methyltransferase
LTGLGLGKTLTDDSLAEETPAFRALLLALRQKYGEARVLDQLESLRRHGNCVDDRQQWLQIALAHSFKFIPIERVQECPCGSRESILLYRFVFWNLLALRQCEGCGLLFVSPRLTKEAMTEVFNKWYFDHSRPERWGRRRLPVFRDILRILRRLDCHSIVDAGAAYGHFLAYVSEHGVDGVGCDISEQSVEWGRSHLRVALSAGSVTDLRLVSEPADCVVSLDTFYYVSDPWNELQAMRKLIRPNGYVILRLRNCLTVPRRAQGKAKEAYCASLLPAEHLWGYAPRTAARLLSQNGFEVVLCQPAAYSRNLLSPLQSSLARLVYSFPFGLPILTRSFNIAARRLD